ncbi:putative DNA oxidative demethylase [Medicago truncatula]|uniref:Putative DNA oxidative demethylase n=1 Tax=Medicago truncatula TaxID=3880 RepID=A0A396HMA7_MEDTR|nr:putative DNA oxidative demethylase [Medicago truncatula]
MKNRERRKEKNQSSKGVELRPGMYHLKGYISLTDQVKIVKVCRELGLGDGGFYQPCNVNGTMLHLKRMCLRRMDKHVSEQSIREGLPVVSFSIGDTAEFFYGDIRDVEKANKILLESGDVLIFGGKSRNIFHGITAIHPYTSSSRLVEETNLRTPGRLNLTFNQLILVRGKGPQFNHHPLTQPTPLVLPVIFNLIFILSQNSN